jgi:hypothetical protein
MVKMFHERSGKVTRFYGSSEPSMPRHCDAANLDEKNFREMFQSLIWLTHSEAKTVNGVGLAKGLLKPRSGGRSVEIEASGSLLVVAASPREAGR